MLLVKKIVAIACVSLLSISSVSYAQVKTGAELDDEIARLARQINHCNMPTGTKIVIRQGDNLFRRMGGVQCRVEVFYRDMRLYTKDNPLKNPPPPPNELPIGFCIERHTGTWQYCAATDENGVLLPGYK